MKNKLVTILFIIFLSIFYRCDFAEPDTTPPNRPVGVYSVTGDRWVKICWIANQEKDLAGYNIYWSYQPEGPYEITGSVSKDYTYYYDYDVINGKTYYYAVTAYDYNGNESDLSLELVHDTPRPAGKGVNLISYYDEPTKCGYNFKNQRVVSFGSGDLDFYYIYHSTPPPGIHYLVAYNGCDIQGFGYTNSLDDVDWAPDQGWAPSGVCEAILGHSYVFWTADYHYAKIRITSVGNVNVNGDFYITFDWAYQVKKDWQELKK